MWDIFHALYWLIVFFAISCLQSFFVSYKITHISTIFALKLYKTKKAHLDYLKYADGADVPIVHFSRFFWPQKCVMRS